MLLNKVNTKNKWFVQVGYYIALVFHELIVNSEAKFVQASNRQWLTSSQSKIGCFVTGELLWPTGRRPLSKHFFALARNVCSRVVKATYLKRVLYTNPLVGTMRLGFRLSFISLTA